MPVFDFSDAPDKKNPAECTYTTFQSSEPEASTPFLWNVYQSGQTYDL